MRAISSASSWIVEDLGEDLPDAVKSSAEILTGAVQRMQHMLDGLLELSRVGAVELDKDFSAAEVIRAIAIDKATVNVDGDARLAGAATAFEAAARKIIDNAVVHHDEGEATVDVEITTDETSALVVFADDGPGIDAYARENAKALFYSIFGAGHPTHVGVGISLAEAYARAHGGDLELHARRPRGTEVRLRWAKAKG